MDNLYNNEKLNNDYCKDELFQESVELESTLQDYNSPNRNNRIYSRDILDKINEASKKYGKNLLLIRTSKNGDKVDSSTLYKNIYPISTYPRANGKSLMGLMSFMGQTSHPRVSMSKDDVSTFEDIEDSTPESIGVDIDLILSGDSELYKEEKEFSYTYKDSMYGETEPEDDIYRKIQKISKNSVYGSMGQSDSSYETSGSKIKDVLNDWMRFIGDPCARR